MSLKIVDPSRAAKGREYVSFSELYLIFQCPYKHNKAYNLKERDEFTFYTAFGSAIHEAIEQKWKHKNDLAWIRMGKIVHLVAQYNMDADGKFNGKNPSEWTRSALRIYKDFFPWVAEAFPDCELYDMEMRLEEPLQLFDRYFLGYIDLILYNPKEDIYHVIDLKTAGWGWNKKQLSDTIKLYQVALYKHFFCRKEKIDRKKVKTHYVLLLRDPAKKEKYAMTLHSMTSGNKKLLNAEEWMYDMAALVKRGIKLKTPASCAFCICGAKKWTPRKKKKTI